MYDVIETELSFEYLKKIIKECEGLKMAIMGGWAVYFYVNENYKKAFGVDYIKSRDIDVYINSSSALKFKKIIEKLKFGKSSYYFRYELIYNRENKKTISNKIARNKPIYNLVYVFLDLFTNKKTGLNAWVFNELNKAKINVVNNIPVVDINTLLRLKLLSFFEREKLDKELKDACDLYSLLIYSNAGFKLDKELKKAIEKIINRQDLCDFIAENVLKDMLKAGIVKATLSNLISSNEN